MKKLRGSPKSEQAPYSHPRAMDKGQQKQAGLTRSTNQSAVQAGGLWSRSHLGMLALPILLLLMSMPAQPRKGAEVSSPAGASSFSRSSRLKRTATAAQSEPQPGGAGSVYQGPTFSGFDCFDDKNPTLLKMPTSCRTEAGGKAYTGKEKMKKSSVNLYQVSTTRIFSGRFCKIERSSSSYLCGTQDWAQILSPPIVGEIEVISASACSDMWSTGYFVDLQYHHKTKVDRDGVTTFAYTARGVLQTSGESIYCYGSTGRVLNGDIIKNSMVFRSYRVTMGTVKGRREVSGHRDAVITEGPLNGVPIKSSQVAGGHIVLGSVTLLLDPSFFNEDCPLARIRKNLKMFVIPGPGSGDARAPSGHPGDRVYSVKGDGGPPPEDLHPYTIVVTAAEDLVLSLGQQQKMPDACGGSQYIKTSHSHVVATIDQEEDENVELLQLDLDLLGATSEYSARLDLLSYLMQVSMASINSQLAQETCLGSAPAMAGLLERAALDTKEGVRRFIPAGEAVYQVKCAKKRFGADWANPKNCSELLPVRELSELQELTGEQVYLLPQTRYTTRHSLAQQCPDMPAAFMGDNGVYYIWQGGKLQVLKPQPKDEVKLDHILLTGLPDLVGKVAGGQEVYTLRQEENLASRVDFGVYVHGEQEATMHYHQEGEFKEGSEGTGSGGTSTWKRLPGIMTDMQNIEHPAASMMAWLWGHTGVPLWHAMTTIGALAGLASAVSWTWGAVCQARALLSLGAPLQGNSMPARVFDGLTLAASAGARAQRIREAEGEHLEDRILRAQARVISTTRALSASSLQNTGV